MSVNMVAIQKSDLHRVKTAHHGATTHEGNTRCETNTTRHRHQTAWRRCTMAHTSRCGKSVQPLETCHCSCGGSLHGSEQVGGGGAEPVIQAPEVLTLKEASDRTPKGEQRLRDAIDLDPNSPTVDPLRTRLYRVKQAEIARKEPAEATEKGDLTEKHTNFAEALAQVSTPDGGFTIDPRTGAAESAGFFVSVHPEHEVSIPVSSLDMNDLTMYEESKREILEQDGNYLGAWHDPETGIVSLDVSSKAQSAEEARRLAAAHGQVAFFDAQTFDSVEVDASQRHRIENLIDESRKND